MKSLEDHNADALKRFQSLNEPHPNGIACPECGHELIDSNPSVSLASWPPQYSVRCTACGYTGYRY